MEKSPNKPGQNQAPKQPQRTPNDRGEGDTKRANLQEDEIATDPSEDTYFDDEETYTDEEE